MSKINKGKEMKNEHVWNPRKPNNLHCISNLAIEYILLKNYPSESIMVYLLHKPLLLQEWLGSLEKYVKSK